MGKSIEYKKMTEGSERMTGIKHEPNNGRSTFGLDPEKVARLLQIGSEMKEAEVSLDLDQEKAAFLNKRLEQTLPLDQSFAKTIPPFVARICERTGLLAGEPIRSLLNNPQTPISLIQKLKEYGKNLSETARTEVETDPALVLYYASIAHAIIHHGIKISRFSYHSLIESFTSLTEKDWIDPECRTLF
ncbi:MAG: hypothetical protein ACYS9H_06255, partial [Planctomycetota bacterium]